METDTRTADQIERDIARERADLSNTLNSLSDTLSFESMSENLTQQVRGMGADVIDDFAGTLIERARQKPVAAGLVLAGLAWMALDSPERRGTSEQRHAATASHGPTPGFESTRAAAEDRIERLANDARILRSRVAEGTEKLSKEASDRVVKAREAAAEAAEQAVEAMRSGAKKTKDVVQDNPLAVGGIALAIGAGLASVMILRNQENTSREARNKTFREADRIMKEELERSGSAGSFNSRA